MRNWIWQWNGWNMVKNIRILSWNGVINGLIYLSDPGFQRLREFVPVIRPYLTRLDWPANHKCEMSHLELAFLKK